MKKIKATTLLLLCLILVFLLSVIQVQAQINPSYGEKISVSIRVVTQQREAIHLATVLLVNRLDSTEKYTAVTDSAGVALFQLDQGKQFITRISAVNYLAIEKGITISPEQQQFIFEAEPLSKTLATAIVSAKKPMITQDDDKTIIDPESLADASTSGFEVIEKTPGLFVDQDGNIYISSLTPASVQINGRDMKMSAADIATMLKSLPPNAIAKIEIVRTPSAKYDASGSGGVVNVVLKKGVKIGMTGSINSGLQQGVYGNQFAGFNLSYNDGKKSSYLNLNYSSRNNYEKIRTDRFFAPDSVLNQDAFTKYPSSVYFTSYGYTQDIGKKWVLDFAGSLTLNDFNNSTNNESEIRKISTAQILTQNLNNLMNDGHSSTFSNGFNGKLKIDSLGSEWSSDIYYSIARNQSEQVYVTQYYLPFSTTTGGDGNSDNSRHTWVMQSDLKLKFKQRFTLEAGLKTSLLNFKSETNYFKEAGGTREKDDARTNTFHYKEQINAAYLQGSKTLGKDVIIKFGTRFENTNMVGEQQVPADTSFTIHRTDLFPYVYLSKNLMKIMGYELRAYLVYRRTINRPFYEQLNPFPRYVDQYLSEAGNPSLRPQFTQNYEANVSVNERPILAIGINDTRDIFTNVIYQADSSQSQAYRTYDNLGKNKEWYLRGLGAIPPGKKYFLVAGAQYNHNFYQGLYENKPLAFKKGTWTFFTYQSLKLDKRSQVTLNGFIRLKGQQQFYELSSFGALNLSINRRFVKDKLTITASISDLYATNNNTFTIQQGSVNASGYRKADTRRGGLNIRYNFGIRKKEENNNLFNYGPPVN